MSKPTAPKRRSLLPREHGAWAELAFPLAGALLLGQGTLAAMLLMAATWAVFLAHEPLLVRLGLRGSRAKREHGARAALRATQLGAGAGVLGLAGLWLAPAAARETALVPLALGGVLVLVIVRKAEKSLPGELLAALALTSPAVPVAFANGLGAPMVWLNAGAWAAVAVLATLAVRAVSSAGRARRPGAELAARRVRAAAVVLSLAGLAALLSGALAGLWSIWIAVGLGPAALFALAVAMMLPHPKQLKRLGIALVVVQSWLLAMLLVGYSHTF